jgi:hypothetical protein
MKVRIKQLPLDKAAYGKQVEGSLSLQPGAFGGADYRESDKKSYGGVNESMSAVPREDANLEAEGGETAFGPISGQSIPDHIKIAGKRHHEGGVPLNLPDDTFVFSDTASLRINDPAILAMFNKTPKKGGHTPAELAKPYNISKYKGILLDPDTGKLERNTATIMIKNYIMKLGALALVQESMKGFPQGIPEMAKPYMEANGISEEDLMPELKEQADALAQSMESQGQPMMAPEAGMMGQEQMMGQEEMAYPEQMPSGAPVASPDMMQQMAGAGSMPPPEMMQQQGMMQEPGMMAYGGVPYAMYGMQMGGYDFPYQPEQMAYGGVPKFQGPDNSQVQQRPTTARAVEPGVYQASDWEIRRDAQGEFKYNKKTGQIQRKEYTSTRAPRGSGSNPNLIKDLCRNMQTPGSFHYGKTAEEVVAYAGLSPAAAATLKGCEVQAPILEEEAIYTDIENENVEAAENENVETLTCKCTDPVTGEVTEFPIEKEEDCNCEDGTEGELSEGTVSAQSIMDSPRWSKNAKLNILRNMAMRTSPAASNVVLPSARGVEGAYEEYQTKVDQALAANSALQTAVMQGMAGPTGKKQSMLKDIAGKSVRAAMDAVANVASRNVDRQNTLNVQNATIENTNNLARAQSMQQALESQRVRQDTETANKNRRLFNTAQAVMDANAEMTARQNLGVTTPQYGTDYDYGFIYPTGVEKPLVGGTGASFEDRIEYYLSKTGDYPKAFDMAYKEARMNRAQYGGYIYGDTIYPFMR